MRWDHLHLARGAGRGGKFVSTFWQNLVARRDHLHPFRRPTPFDDSTKEAWEMTRMTVHEISPGN
jgi:hypothetical protein